MLLKPVDLDSIPPCDSDNGRREPSPANGLLTALSKINIIKTNLHFITQCDMPGGTGGEGPPIKRVTLKWEWHVDRLHWLSGKEGVLFCFV